MLEVDVAVVGAGAAGLTLAWHLAEAQSGLHVALLEPPGPPGRTGDHAGARSPLRTWCSWSTDGAPFADAAAANWGAVDVVGPAGHRRRLDLSPYAYRMLRSTDLERLVHGRLADDPATTVLAVRVEEVLDGDTAALVRGVDGEGRAVQVRAGWVLDSRPHPPVGGRTHLLQHFRGWFVRTQEPAFDPASAVLMDFRTRQPRHGVSFGYVLPTSEHEALVEYTEFGRRRLPADGYEDALRRYVDQTLRLPPFEVTDVEDGAIPMTDARFTRRAGRRIFRIGTSGGATRPSTGYTLTAAQRQARSVARLLVAGREPMPPPAYPRRHALMDAVMLRALDSGRLDGAAFFDDLFARHPPALVLRFLDGASSPAEELAVMAGSPRAPMIASAVELLTRVR